MKKNTLLFTSAILSGFLVLTNFCHAQNRKDSSAPASKAQTLKKYGLDPTTDLLSRVKDTSPEIIQKFKDAGMAPRRHELTTAERTKIAKAFAALPPLHQRVLRERLHSISFLDNMPNTALTSSPNPDDPYNLYDITFRAAILNQNVSEWVTEKENTLFKPDSSNTSVAVEAGNLDAILYVILHESTHVVDASLNLTGTEQPGIPGSVTAFPDHIWKSRLETVPQFTDSLLQQIVWRRNGKLIAMENAASLYRSLQKTPFVSVYGSNARPEDLAEYVSVYHFTQKLDQPYKIVVRREGKEVLVYEPMKSELVSSRTGNIQQFYKSKS
jgi:hypothetical protein